MDADVVVVGAGLAGLTAAAELTDAGRSVVLVDAEGEQDLGGQASWSFGGLFLVDTPEQRRLGVRDSAERAWADWEATAGFDRPEDAWARRWARAFVDFAAGEERAWLHAMGHRLFPVVGWAERAGNSVPRFHVTWGTGPGVVAPFERRVRAAAGRGLLRFAFRHRVEALTTTGGVVDGVSGSLLAGDPAPRGAATSRTATGTFALRAQAVVVTAGGIGGDHDLVRAAWPARLGAPPQRMLAGVPASVDGAMLAVTAAAGGAILNPDRMWHYVEGLTNPAPRWERHGIRILPGPSSLWLDATGRRLPPSLFPGADTLATLEHLRATGYDTSWFLTTRRIIGKEFALSGSEQNPDLTGRSVRGVLGRVRTDVPAPVQSFLDAGLDVVTSTTGVGDLVARMNALTGDAPHVDADLVAREVAARDAALADPASTDPQVLAIRSARRYLGDRLVRVAAPHSLLDPAAGPLMAVRLSVLTRKTLGGVATDLDGRVLDATGAPIGGLYAAGECAGFGGGGMHGYRSLEGTFLGGCLFTGRTVGRAVAAATA